ncbi:hypothetical protein CU100_09820 [Phyllobacterium endophyticum]|uniref:Uncharacterized protein n=2 Tax=Phyllobacterium endophyticum TaxID=1149773 RepID=A0A2P7AUS0_9HYPH|nr:hypothetical protein CU100_09820 [Phyllobacterium endophyticum]
MALGNMDMPNGNGMLSEEARFAALSQRVTGIETSVSGLAQQLSQFVAKFDERQRTPWGLLVSIALAILAYVTTIGGLAYAPVWSAISRIETTQSQSQQRLETALTRFSESAVSLGSFTDFKNTYENNRIISRNENIDKFGVIKQDIDKIKDDQVPRKEHERVWLSYDAQLAADREARMAASQNLQRQIDEIKQTQSGFFGQRDLNMQVLDRLERIERDRRAASP